MYKDPGAPKPEGEDSETDVAAPPPVKEDEGKPEDED